MAYVTVPKDLTHVKSKVLFGLTKRQLVCFGGALLTGGPLYFLARNYLSNSAAAMLMIFAMLPGLLFALFERHGQPLEVVIQQKMAYVPDNPQLDEYMTGLQYINFICDIYEVPSKMRKQNFEKLALAFQMGPHLNNLISSYSHGMKQKLALIAAFSHTPKLLILDEPFVGLDPEAFVILKEQMKELCASGNSVLFSSHILDVVEKVCNKVSVIKHGQLLYSGRTTEIVGTKGLEEVFMEMNGDEISVTPTKE